MEMYDLEGVSWGKLMAHVRAVLYLHCDQDGGVCSNVVRVEYVDQAFWFLLVLLFRLILIWIRQSQHFREISCCGDPGFRFPCGAVRF